MKMNMEMKMKVKVEVKIKVKVKVIHYFEMMEVSSGKFNVNVNVPGDEV